MHLNPISQIIENQQDKTTAAAKAARLAHNKN
jgi:hypothetical protein